MVAVDGLDASNELPFDSTRSRWFCWTIGAWKMDWVMDALTGIYIWGFAFMILVLNA